MAESDFNETIAAKWLNVPCKVCGKKYGDHTLTDMKRCWFFKELIKNELDR